MCLRRLAPRQGFSNNFHSNLPETPDRRQQLSLPPPAMVSWATLQTLLVILGPIIYSRGKAFYISIKSSGPPRPMSTAARRLLNILFITAVIALASTFDFFTPENIFTKTSSRLQIPTDVLFTRLSKMRELTPQDETLRSRLLTKEARLLYAAYGPAPLMECNWCSLENPNTFLFYALPNLALPHLLHIAVLGIVTSSFLSSYGRIWRTQATIAGLGLLLAEVYLVGISKADYKHNTGAKSTEEVHWTHWRVHFLRGVGMSLVDACLGYAIFLTATGRWNWGLETLRMEERLETLRKATENLYGKLHVEGHLRQTVLGHKDLRERSLEYWTTEENTRAEIMQNENVANARSSLNIDLTKLTEEAGTKSDFMMETIASWRGLRTQSSSTPTPSPP